MVCRRQLNDAIRFTDALRVDPAQKRPTIPEITGQRRAKDHQLAGILAT